MPQSLPVTAPPPEHESSLAGLVAGAETMSRVLEQARRAALSDTPTLLEGEPSTGKARIARAIHDESERGPFVTVNCATCAGDWSGACPGGTLFLDEIADLPADAQARLFQTLQDRRSGTGFRLIAATAANLIDRVRNGQFREDLYYQLIVLPIWMPPLRERLKDVPELVRRFLRRFAAEEGKTIEDIEPQAAAMLQRYPWPGNLRQLENAVFRAVILADGPMLTVSEFPQVAAHVDGFFVTVPDAPAPAALRPHFDGPVMLGQPADIPATVPVPVSNGRNAIGIRALSDSGDVRSLEAVEADMIRLALGRYRGRMTEVAKRLGIGRSTLYRKMREIGIEARPQ